MPCRIPDVAHGSGSNISLATYYSGPAAGNSWNLYICFIWDLSWSPERKYFTVVSTSFGIFSLENWCLIVSYICSSLGAPIRSNSERKIVYNRVMRLERTCEVLHALGPVVLKQRRGHMEMMRPDIWESRRWLGVHDLKLALAETFPTFESLPSLYASL